MRVDCCDSYWSFFYSFEHKGDRVGQAIVI